MRDRPAHSAWRGQGSAFWRVTIVASALVLAGLACNFLDRLPSRKTTAPNGNNAGAPTPLDALTPTTAVPPPASGVRLVGYFTSWSIYARGYHAWHIPAQKLTHLNYAFANLSKQGKCISGDPRADQTNFPELEQLRRDYPHLKLLISIGGPGTAKKFAAAARSQEGRERLARSCVSFMRENGFQGIDIDWEFPSAEDRENFPLLLKELRRQLDGESGLPRPLLTIAAGASLYQIEDLILSGEGSILSYLDWINLMTYDFHGPWSPRTNFNAPLYASPADPAESELERLTFNVHSSVQAYLTAGTPRDKIVLGVPFFGRGWQGISSDNKGLYQPHEGAAPGTWGGEGGTYDYKDLAENYLTNREYTQHWHEQALVPWLFSATHSIFISYDDPRSLAAKAAYVRENGLGGIMIWQLAADDAQSSLLTSLYQALFPAP